MKTRNRSDPSAACSARCAKGGLARATSAFAARARSTTTRLVACDPSGHPSLLEDRLEAAPGDASFLGLALFRVGLSNAGALGAVGADAVGVGGSEEVPVRFELQSDRLEGSSHSAFHAAGDLEGWLQLVADRSDGDRDGEGLAVLALDAHRDVVEP